MKSTLLLCIVVSLSSAAQAASGFELFCDYRDEKTGILPEDATTQAYFSSKSGLPMKGTLTIAQGEFNSREETVACSSGQRRSWNCTSATYQLYLSPAEAAPLYQLLIVPQGGRMTDSFTLPCFNARPANVR